MKKLVQIFVMASLVFACADLAAAQEEAGHKPPKVLVITREFVKPGKGGATHEKAESLYVQAMTRAKSPVHYIGMEGVSGRARALFFAGYESFDAWQTSEEAEQKDEALSAGLAHADAVDGELLEGIDHTVWYLDEEGSYNTSVDLPHMRYFEIERFTLRQGHEREWTDVVKLVKAAYAKALPEMHWAMYASVYGIASPAYLVIVPMKSGADIDKAFANNPKFAAAMGEDGMKKLSALSAAAIESSETNLFAINPKMSYVGEDMVKADPEFWRPKASAPAAGAKKAGEKPAAKP